MSSAPLQFVCWLLVQCPRGRQQRKVPWTGQRCCCRDAALLELFLGMVVCYSGQGRFKGMQIDLNSNCSYIFMEDLHILGKHDELVSMQICPFAWISSFLKQIRLHIGMYSVYFERWLNKIDPEQFYVTTLEEYKLDKNKVISKILHFLNVG